MPDVLFRRAQSARLLRLVWPVLALFVLVSALMTVAITWSTSEANQLAKAREARILEAAIEERAAEVASAASAIARVLDTDRGTVARPLSRRHLPFEGLSGVALFGDDGKLLSRRDLDAAEEADAALALLGRALAVPEGLNEGRLLVGPGAVVAASAASTAGTVVAYRRLSPEALLTVGATHGLADLSVYRQAPGDGVGALAVPDVADGAPAAYLTWRPDRPGDILRARLVPPLMFGMAVALLLFAAFVSSVRRTAARLDSVRLRAEGLVGRDPLSGLPNRQLFASRLDQELSRIARTGEGLAVLFLDLDRFKDVNDTFGHQAGDALLTEVAKRLGEVLRGEDTLARFGGDEFAIIQTRTASAPDAGALSRRILDALTQPFVLGGTPVTVGASIGIALAPGDGLERETLMRLADTALYQAKSGGRNRFCFFAREMDETIRMRKLVEDELRIAIKSDGLALHYQPIYSADGERVLCVEALVRWPHPVHGLISPAKFVPIAEERGLVIPLGEWVLRRACRDAARWPGVRLAVNVSALQFHHRDFVASVLRATGEAGFDPANLEIELTEGVLVDDEDAAEAAMMELRAHGVRLALDDFGTGYSSLIYLRRFAFDKIKIDRSFLQSLEAKGESAVLVHSIVHLGRALGLTVTAEGVETREQHRFLQALGCHQLQGYLFSRPVTAEAIDVLVAPEAIESDAA